MVLYHMSETLKIGDELKSDYKEYADLAEPFIKALEYSFDTFYGMLLTADYMGCVFAKYDLKGMPTHEIKWATEGVFEYVRRKEFPDACSRLQSNYYFDNLDNCKELFIEDWENATQEEKNRIRLFEIELNGNTLKCDMRLFDEAFDLMYDLKCPEDLEKIKDLARKYFSGEKGEDYIMEIISDSAAVAKKDITEKKKKWDK